MKQKALKLPAPHTLAALANRAHPLQYGPVALHTDKPPVQSSFSGNVGLSNVRTDPESVNMTTQTENHLIRLCYFHDIGEYSNSCRKSSRNCGHLPYLYHIQVGMKQT
jgi:hypothetical protein